MRNLILCFLILGSTLQNGFTQGYFAKYHTFADNQLNFIDNFLVSGDSIYFRMTSADTNPSTLKTRMATMDVNSSEFNEDVYLEQVETGSSLIKDGNTFVLSSEEKEHNSHITLNKLDMHFNFLDSIHLKINDGVEYEYYIKKAIAYQDKYIIGALAVKDNGYTYISTVFFIVNKDLIVEKTLVVPPDFTEIRILDYAINPVDNNLYICTNYNMPNINGNGIPFIYQRILKLDEQFELSTYWEYTKNVPFSWSPIVFSKSGDLYIFIDETADDEYLMKLNSNKMIEWQMRIDTPFFYYTADSTIVLDTANYTSRKYIVRDLTLSGNGDVVGVGNVWSTDYNIGSSSYLFRTSPEGVKKWDKVIRSNIHFGDQSYGYENFLVKVVEMPNGDLLAGGQVIALHPYASPTALGRQEAWLVRTDSNGCITDHCGYIQDVVQKLSYLPIVSSKNEWTVQHFEIGSTTKRKYTFLEDSVFMNSAYWHELVYTDELMGYRATNRFYREENGQVFESLSNGVVYDLNLQSNETLSPNTIINQGERRIETVGSVLLLDGIPRKKQLISCSNDPINKTEVIEGIGDIEVLFSSETMCLPIVDGPTDILQCFSVDGQSVYVKAGVESCDLSKTKDFFITDGLSIFPNPSANNITISLENQEGKLERLEVFNLLGHLVYTCSTPSACSLQKLDVSFLHAGSYFVRLGFESNRVAVGKFIKE